MTRGLPAAVTVLFLLVPVVSPSFQVVDLALKIALFGTLAASYDVLIGYTGIVSFGHAMFFGIGAYSVALALKKLGDPTYGTLVLGVLAGVGLAAVLSLAVSAFSLRVKAIFYAMVTLAFAEFAFILAMQLTPLTGGEDGVSPRLPGVLDVAYAGRLLGVPVTGRVLAYYLVLLGCVALFVLMRRFVRSPLGHTLRAVRDNALRAEALGIRTFGFQVAASGFASVVAAALGAGYAIWVRYVNPESALGIPIMLDILLMVVIGGIGTLHGGVVGAAFLVTARTLLPDLRGLATLLMPGSELASRLAERWLLYFGVAFILVVFFFPRGVLGTLAARRRGGP